METGGAATGGVAVGFSATLAATNTNQSTIYAAVAVASAGKTTVLLVACAFAHCVQ